jgi:hypothetical protein
VRPEPWLGLRASATVRLAAAGLRIEDDRRVTPVQAVEPTLQEVVAVSDRLRVRALRSPHRETADRFRPPSVWTSPEPSNRMLPPGRSPGSRPTDVRWCLNPPPPPDQRRDGRSERQFPDSRPPSKDPCRTPFMAKGR